MDYEILVHEAGHAVVAHVFGYEVASITIDSQSSCLHVACRHAPPEHRVAIDLAGILAVFVHNKPRGLSLTNFIKMNLRRQHGHGDHDVGRVMLVMEEIGRDAVFEIARDVWEFLKEHLDDVHRIADVWKNLSPGDYSVTWSEG